ncbi:MAG: hypothetical protein VX620_15340 [Pseudomonadota bacterium]|nr:hypothetical protein [Pseudomonadota bacterium]
MERTTNVTHIPICRPVSHPASRPAPRPANDADRGPLRLRTPKDVLDDHDARRKAGLSTACRDHTRPHRFECVSVTLPGDPFPRRATVMCAPENRNTALIRYHHADGPSDACPMAAWVHITQLTYPNRNADCGGV